MSRHNSLSRSAVLPRPLHLSSPRRRGPIRRVVAMGHGRRTTGHAGVMGPRLRGDDSREGVLNIKRMDLERIHCHFLCSLAKNCSLSFHLARTLSAYWAETVLTLGNSSFQANGRTA